MFGVQQRRDSGVGSVLDRLHLRPYLLHLLFAGRTLLVGRIRPWRTHTAHQFAELLISVGQDDLDLCLLIGGQREQLAQALQIAFDRGATRRSSLIHAIGWRSSRRWASVGLCSEGCSKEYSQKRGKQCVHRMCGRAVSLDHVGKVLSLRGLKFQKNPALVQR